MNTFGYIREAVQAHTDLDEAETQAMLLQGRYYIYANEAMQAICAIVPKYQYFVCKAVKHYNPIVPEGDSFRIATEQDDPDDFASEADTKTWYESKGEFLLNTPIRMPQNFINFAENQAYVTIDRPKFEPELFVKGRRPNCQNTRTKAGTKEFSYYSKNTIVCHVPGIFEVPYKSMWYQFSSGMSDTDEIDMPSDIFLCIPLYIASLCLQVDNTQRAMLKRSEFEAALARCTTTSFLELKDVSSYK